MGAFLPITRGLVLLPEGLAPAEVAHLARMPHGNVDGRLDVTGSSPGPLGTGPIPERHHAPTAK